MSRVALITGITGQDGSYLAELLLGKGYQVHGVMRRTSTFTTDRIDHIHGSNDNFHLHHGDMLDPLSLMSLLEAARPDEVYNLAAQSHVKVSFDIPVYTAQSVAMGTLNLLECIQRLRLRCRFYQAGSSEMFGDVVETPQKESTPFNPQSMYAVSKVFAHHSTVAYRRMGMFACNGILFNHESPRRGGTFVTKKITDAVANIKAGRQKKLALGNLRATRDWGHARDYVEAMWLMLQQQDPDDYVIATGSTYTVEEFLEIAFGLVNLKWQDYVVVDSRYFRPNEVNTLLGDASKAREKLGWTPKVKFEELVKEMVESSMEEVKA